MNQILEGTESTREIIKERLRQHFDGKIVQMMNRSSRKAYRM